ncbi:hypothetical protein GF389_04705 [Candidatus Dojkabacteria bacterium]|nr:hypothetical protein [Candidatus Dojkabacteria bacterium]
MKGRLRRYTIILLLVLTLGLAGASVYIGYQLSTEDQAPEDSSAAGGPCQYTESGICPPVNWFGWDATEAVLQKAKDNPGVQYMAACNGANDGGIGTSAVIYDLDTFNKCGCEILSTPASGCIQRTCSTCDNPTAICSSNQDGGGGGDDGGGGGEDEPPPEEDVDYPISFRGSVYCQEGDTQYPMENVRVMVRNDDPASGERVRATDTTGTGGNFRINFDNIRWGGHFDVLITDIDETKTLSNGTSHADVVLANTYCDYSENSENLKCINVEEDNPDYEKGFIECAVTDENYQDASRITDFGYEFYDHCRVKRSDSEMWNGNPTANNFDFIFTNCSSPAEQRCGDGVCATGEFCELPETRSAIQCPSGDPLDVNCRDDCTYCGDGVINGSEECDHGGTPTAVCDANCENVIPQDTQACLALRRQPDDDPVGPNEVELFEVDVNTTGSTQPYYPDDVKLRVSLTTDDVPVGEDTQPDPAHNGQSIVTSYGAAMNADETTWTYSFAWIASDLANGSYEVEVSFDGGTTWDDTAACIYDFTYSATEAVEPTFLIVKTGNSVCSTAGGATLSYTLTVTNLGPGSGVITSVTDDLDSDVQDSWVTNITSSSGVTGTVSSGTITWAGTEEQRTFTENETQTYSYTINVPTSSLSIVEEGVENMATVVYGDDQVRYSFYLDDLCGTDTTVGGTLPSTGIMDETPWILGISAMLVGLIALKLGGGNEFVYPALKKIRFTIFTNLGLKSLEANARKDEMEERFN